MLDITCDSSETLGLRSLFKKWLEKVSQAGSATIVNLKILLYVLVSGTVGLLPTFESISTSNIDVYYKCLPVDMILVRSGQTSILGCSSWELYFLVLASYLI